MSPTHRAPSPGIAVLLPADGEARGFRLNEVRGPGSVTFPAH